MQSFLPQMVGIDEYDLRLWQSKDASGLQTIFEQNEEFLRRYLPFPQKKQSLRQTYEWIHSKIAAFYKGEDFSFAVIERSSQQIVGGIGFHLRGRYLNERKADVGIWLKPQFCGNGLGRRLVSAFSEWGFDGWP